jgi:hypothetical protein
VICYYNRYRETNIDVHSGYLVWPLHFVFRGASVIWDIAPCLSTLCYSVEHDQQSGAASSWHAVKCRSVTYC